MSDDTPAETKWFWRRLYIYGFSVWAMALVSVIVVRVAEPGDPRARIALWLIGLTGFLATLYIAGASAKELALIFKAANPWAKNGGDPGPASEPPPTIPNEETR
jgi:hypothetical protein